MSAQVLSMLHYAGGPNGLTLQTLPYTPLLGLTYLMLMLPTALAVGVPSMLALRKRRLARAVVIIPLGTLAGAAWALPFVGSNPPPYDLALFFGLGGFIASVVFWLAYARANNSSKPTPLRGAA